MTTKKIPQKILDEMKNYPPFYVKVWKACFAIPAGKTMSYGELAKKTGSPGAARAVGGAMRSNPWPPVIPCHRVISSTGKMCGYSVKGGTKVKEKMLAYEKETGKDAGENILKKFISEENK